MSAASVSTKIRVTQYPSVLISEQAQCHAKLAKTAVNSDEPKVRNHHLDTRPKWESRTLRPKAEKETETFVFFFRPNRPERDSFGNLHTASDDETMVAGQNRWDMWDWIFRGFASTPQVGGICGTRFSYPVSTL